MVKLKCGCEITENGKFIVSKLCLDTNCLECNMIPEIHPFGKKRVIDYLNDNF